MEVPMIPSEITIKHLEESLTKEPERIIAAKKNGVKVVGYFCPYIPEELIMAAGMIPIRLAFGGEISAAVSGADYLKSNSCPYARSCLGFKVEGKNEYFKLVDALCIAQTCGSMKQVGEYWEKYQGIPVFKLGLPHTHDAYRSRPQALEYFTKEISLLRDWLAEFAGKPIKNGEIRQAISLCNSIRETQRILFEFPRDYSPPIEWHDAIRIVQLGYVLNRSEYLNEITNLVKKLHKQPKTQLSDNRIRLMIAGSIIGIGDQKILEIIKASGGNIVADVICTGSMFTRKNVTIFGIMGSPIEALAEHYLYNIPCPCMTDSSKRLNRMVKIARDYQVSGLIYYSLKYCDTWRAEFQTIKETLYKDVIVASLLIESNYSPSDIEAIRAKIEAFIEMRGGKIKCISTA
jgi:benzoyl-CoA reductase/2-hydroxyglutaryl-CoA dehydratase subunit BcrC/BadD/HgdB